MLNIDKFAHAYGLTGATSKELENVLATSEAVNEIRQEPDIHERVAEALTQGIGNPAKLTKRLDEIARWVDSERTRTEVQKVAQLQLDGVLAEWLAGAADDLVTEAGKALQPVLDSFVESASTLPKYVTRERFPVTADWTPEQHSAWVQLQPTLDRLEKIRHGLSELYTGLDVSGIDPAHRPWFAWISPKGARDLSEVLHGTRDTSGRHNVNSQAFNQWVALAHMAKAGTIELALVSPSDALNRMNRYVNARAAMFARAREQREGVKSRG